MEETNGNEKGGGNSLVRWWGASVLAILALFGAWYVLVREDTPLERIGTEAREEAPATAAARVNGEVIPRAAFDARLAAVKAQAGGENIPEPELKTRAIDGLIAEVLIRQGAESSGVEVTEDDIAAEVSRIRSQFDTDVAYEDALSAQGVTEEVLRERIRNQLYIQTYLREQIGVEAAAVSDAEVESAYDEIAVRQEGVPALDNAVREQIRAQLTQQKQQQLVSDLVRALRANAEIEVLI